MAALNEADFADPTSLLAAMGHSTRPEEQIWLDPPAEPVWRRVPAA